MLQLRPTFSESWYRVAGLRAKLRASAQISRQYYRGERWYVVRDPAGNQYHRLSDAAYRFVGLLDGTRTVAEAWDLVGQLADDSPTQPEVIQILSQLYAANLMEADITPDATVLLRRHKQLMKRQLQGRLMNVLFPRIPIWDPDKFLKRWMPVARVFLSYFGIVLWLVVVAAGVAKVAPMMSELKQAATDSIDPSNWLLLWVTFALIKFWHELGHAMMCRRFGGEVHEMGIMFLVFIPTPYVDASTAWAFPSRWQRMAVGAAGMIFELFLASILAWVWAATQGSPGLVHQLCFNAMLVASVTTVVFNANPLLRYDGYYMLSDFLEIPNLQQKSQEYLLGLIKRHIFRIKARQPLPPPLQRIWLFFYGLASAAYRIFVGITIIVVVAFKVPVLGILMSLGGVATWVVVPAMKLTRYLALDPELHRKRGRATAFSFAVAAAVVVAIGVIKFPVHYRAEGYAEAENLEVLHAGMPGFVSDIRVHDGDPVKKGDVLVVLRNLELKTQVVQYEKAIEQLNAKLTKAKAEDPNMVDEVKAELAATRSNLADTNERVEMLTIRAPIDGVVVAPKLKEIMGKFVARGEDLLQVSSMDKLLIKVMLEQKDAQLWSRTGITQAAEAEIRMAGLVDAKPLTSRNIELIPAAHRDLPHQSLGTAGGGEIQTNPKDPNKPLTEQFEMHVKLDNPPGVYGIKGRQFYPGQRAYLRFTMDEKMPLMWNWWRKIQQLIGTYSKTKWGT